MTRRFSDIKDDIIIEQIKELNEGVYDPGIFKAFFLAGGPGSGKSYVQKKTTGGMGLKVVNSDDIYEKMLKDAGMDTTPEDIYSDKGQEIRGRAKATTKRMQSNFLMGRLGVVIDGTGKDFEKIQRQAAALKQLGYDTYMIFVNTSEEVAQQRNQERKRTLPRDEVTKMWNGVQRNIGAFQRFFGNKNFIILDNNGPNDDVLSMVFKRVRKLVTTPVKNYIAKQWIANELEKKRRR
jgi:dephospho-CoA kinase